MSDQLAQITERVRNTRTPLVIAIDGRSGGGKTALASVLTDHLAVALADRSVRTVHVDDFVAGWFGLADVVTVLRKILHDITVAGVANARRWDWDTESSGEILTIKRADVIIVEGCACGARALAPYVDLLIWVELDAATRYHRAIARDGAAYEPWWDMWAAQEDQLYAAEQVAERADLIWRST